MNVTGLIVAVWFHEQHYIIPFHTVVLYDLSQMQKVLVEIPLLISTNIHLRYRERFLMWHCPYRTMIRCTRKDLTQTHTHTHHSLFPSA